MEAVAVQQSPASAFPPSYNSASASQRADELVIAQTLTNQPESTQEANFEDLYKSLSITAKQVVDKINELLKAKLPNGVQSLSPEEVTPDATAERIVQGATSYFDVFAKQNPELQGAELLNRFLDTIKGGIETGYNQAAGTLEELGAFEFDGVKSGIEKTKELIGEKLAAWEAYMRKEMGLDSPETEVPDAVATDILAQAGATVAQNQKSLDVFA